MRTGGADAVAGEVEPGENGAVALDPGTRPLLSGLTFMGWV